MSSAAVVTGAVRVNIYFKMSSTAVVIGALRAKLILKSGRYRHFLSEF